VFVLNKLTNEVGMKKVALLSILVVAVLLAVSVMAQAQQPTKIPRIGYLATPSHSSISDRYDAFLHGLRELGYVQGKDITIERRTADGKVERLPDLATGLVRLKVDIIVTGGPGSTRAAKDATNTIPIVMAQDFDPVGTGIVVSLARPGGNITGLSTLSPEISGKQLELLKEIVPRLSRVAVLGNSTIPGNLQSLREMELVAPVVGVKLQYLEVLGPKDIETALRAAIKGRAEAILALGNSVLLSQRTQVVVGKNRLPAIYSQREFLEAGGLITYGPNFADLWRHAALYVDKILKGAKPADLPVEQPKKFEFVINLKAAKQIGLTIPPNVLVRADKVIR
jgi:putative ABC transport system substrate-binding protein